MKSKKHCCKCIKVKDACIEISCLPYVIEKSGKYCLKKDLTWSGVGVAILIESDDVSLDGNFHKLSIKKPGSVIVTENISSWDPNIGIKVNGPVINNLNLDDSRFKNITIKNMTIGSKVNTPNPSPLPSSPSAQSVSTAIRLIGCSHINITNVVLDKTTHGIETQNVDGLRIQDSQFIDNYGIRFQINPFFVESYGSNIFQYEDSTDLKIERCMFIGRATGDDSLISFGIFGNSDTLRNRDILIVDCDFNNSDSAIHPIQGKNIIVDRCNIYCDKNNYRQIQLGSNINLEQTVENFKITNSNIWASDGNFLIQLVLGNNALFQNLNITYFGAFSFLIGFPDPSIKFNNVVIDNINIQGDYLAGFFIFNSNNITIENSTITNTNNPIIINPIISNTDDDENLIIAPIKSDFITILNNEITGNSPIVDGSVGIYLAYTNSSVIKNNRIRSFCTAIQLESNVTDNSDPPITAGPLNNVIEGNTIVNNADTGQNPGESIIYDGNDNNNLITRFNVNPNPNIFYNNNVSCGFTITTKTKTTIEEYKLKIKL
ncbi:putative pectin lyase [Fadolivirus algeromassiliense]|jgi:hypothetical protein|uniref:Pectin lyase n=1 Tax=Fadolivirus FV1/VV64 TaxID=3070911 RepID=A0A7D3UQR4_9VIRU|nr:putative pectin lyase [Fadolivirus algeromassiliense]QKF94648.1 putative pectin lyase [Fadolivirus FV1/VV64]